MTAAVVLEGVKAIGEALPKLLELWQLVGGRRDAFFTAIDGTLTVVRAQHDAELARKHRRPSIRVPVDDDDEG